MKVGEGFVEIRGLDTLRGSETITWIVPQQIGDTVDEGLGDTLVE